MKTKNFPPVKNVIVKRTKNGQRYLYHLKDSLGHDVYQTIPINDSDTKESYLKKIEDARIKLEMKAHEISMDKLLDEYADMKKFSQNSIRSLKVSLRGFNLNDANNIKQVNELLKKDTKPVTKSNQLSYVRCFYSWLKNVKNLEIRNPADAVIVRAKTHHRERTLNDSEIETLLNCVEASKQDDLILFTRLLVFTGARVSSVYSITPISIRNSRIYLYNVKCKRDYSYAIPIQDERTIELFNKLVKNGKGKIFKRSQVALQSALNIRMNKLFPKDENGETISPHSLRHTFATKALQKGIPPEIVSRMLDHSSINTTLTIYAKHSQKQIDDAVALLFDEKKGDPKSED